MTGNTWQIYCAQIMYYMTVSSRNLIYCIAGLVHITVKLTNKVGFSFMKWKENMEVMNGGVLLFIYL